jgi:hypothetical protein
MEEGRLVAVRAEIPVALFFFNIGVEVGQLLFVASLLVLSAAPPGFRLRPESDAALGRVCEGVPKGTERAPAALALRDAPGLMRLRLAA